MIVAVVAPEWAMQNVLGVFLTHRIAGDDVVALAEEASVRAIVREQWAAIGLAKGLRRVARFGDTEPVSGQDGSTTPDVMLVLESPRASTMDLARRDRSLLWAEERGLCVVRGALASDAFAPGWDVARLLWRRELFQIADESSGHTSPAAAAE